MMKNTWTFRRMMGAATAIALAAFVLVGCSAERNSRTVTVDIGGGVTMDMVWIAPGIFTMGQNHDMPHWSPAPERQVTLTRGFHMGVHAVTQAQFYAVMGVNPSYFYDNPAEGEAQERRPVEMVSWYHAIAFANRLSILQGLEPVYSIAGMSNTDADAWLFANVPVGWDDPRRAAWDAVTMNRNADGFRLPTDAEWEFAARAGTTTEWSFGDTDADIDYYAWTWPSSGDRTREVGLLRPNAWGLYDMHGNVWERVWDWSWIRNWWDTPETAPATDPTGAATGFNRVARGGSCRTTPEDARSAFSFSFSPAYRGNSLGFRVVRH